MGKAQQDSQLTESLEAWLGSLDTSWGLEVAGDFGAREYCAQYCV